MGHEQCALFKRILRPRFELRPASCFGIGILIKAVEEIGYYLGRAMNPIARPR